MGHVRDLLRGGHQLSDVVDRFVSERLPAVPPRPREPKHINDPVWKTIRILPAEAAIIDTPLFQRLRRIRQLGVAELVFPGAGYTRFEHSVGTLQAMEVLCRALLTLDEQQHLSPKQYKLLRLAALLHDIGHCAYSHVSEGFYRSLSLGGSLDLDRLRLSVDEAIGHRPSPSELLSAAIITSDPFIKYLESIPTGVALAADEISEWIATILLGGYPEPDRPLLTQLLTGPFDADKLDYMQRDCLMAGIPLPVDIPRLVEKIRPVEVPVSRLPPAMQKRFNLKPDTKVTVLGVALSGARAVEEMLIARVILFDKLYYHFKIRAAEVLVRRALGELRAGGALPDLGAFLRLDDLKLCAIADPEVAQALNIGESPSKLLLALRDRQLPRRAFCFGHAFMLKEETSDSEWGWPNLLDDCRDAERRRELEEEIRRVAALILEGMKRDVADLQHVFISYADPSRVHTSIETFVITSDRQVVPFRHSRDNWGDDVEEEGTPFKYHFDVDRWADAYETNKAFGFVFCDGKAQAAVHVATESVLLDRYSVRFGDAAVHLCKLDHSEIEKAKRAADSLRLYEGQPALRPLQDVLQRSNNRTRVRGIAKGLRDFEGSTGVRVTEARVRSWANQFSSDHVNDALTLAEKLRIPTRKDFVEGVRAFVASRETLSNAVWVPLGAPTDSASTWGYYLKDPPTVFRTLSLEQALRHKGSPIVLFDDCVSSGTQVKDIIAGWLGDSTKLGEDHGDPLPDDLRSELRNRDVYFFFFLAHPEARDKVRTGVENLLLNVKEVHAAQSLPIDGLADAGYPLGHVFRAELERIGEALLTSTKSGDRWPPDRIENSRLGYGNKAQLLVLPKNVPVFTVTAIWSEGTVAGRHWLPLVPRRSK